MLLPWRQYHTLKLCNVVEKEHDGSNFSQVFRENVFGNSLEISTVEFILNILKTRSPQLMRKISETCWDLQRRYSSDHLCMAAPGTLKVFNLFQKRAPTIKFLLIFYPKNYWNLYQHWHHQYCSESFLK